MFTAHLIAIETKSGQPVHCPRQPGHSDSTDHVTREREPNWDIYTITALTLPLHSRPRYGRAVYRSPFELTVLHQIIDARYVVTAEVQKLQVR